MSQPAVSQNIILSLGPFQGITDHVFRNIFRLYFGGIDKMYTPFFTGIHKVNSKNLQGAEIDPLSNDTSSLVPQLLTNEAFELYNFSEYCKGLGYSEININLGCPYPRVAKKQRGSGLLAHPQKIDQLLEQHFSSNPLATGIKCRLGYENTATIKALATVFNRYPISELIIHARTGKQLYKGQVLLDEFEEILNDLIITPGYNGDLFSQKDFIERKKRFPAINHFMLGRGILSDPFLAMDIRAIDSSETDRKQIVQQFVEAIYLQRRAFSNDNLSIIGRMKELWSYLKYSFDDPQAIWRLIKKNNSFETYETAVKQAFENHNWIGQGFPKDEEQTY
ncbi:MAG: tRNA-dihydrouridine synthase family protein [Bacteroidetes bacterium]|nr:tRNA-dihydrouridine synthase family protein [Bacteroidota bacterium]MBU1580436.1 tRNA-dihydrouridine synthase family protein [Bacteroidota bacterium]MBU2557117.1 tRNA-dihydrouridine synthase family protein [Bacteroidota bacterium]